MNRTIPWLGALICAAGLSSSASAWTWPPFAGLRHGTCTTCTGDQGTAPATKVVTDQNNLPTGTTVHGGIGCHTGALGHLSAIPQHVSSCARDINQWLLNVPQKTPPPPKQHPINPYVRSPRDFFMMDDP